MPVQQNEIMSLAKVNAQNLKEKTEAKTKLQCDEIVKQLDKIILSQKETVKNDTVNEIYQIGVEIAQKETKKMLNNNLHRKLINLSIDELDKIEGALL